MTLQEFPNQLGPHSAGPLQPLPGPPVVGAELRVSARFPLQPSLSPGKRVRDAGLEGGWKEKGKKTKKMEEYFYKTLYVSGLILNTSHI